MLKAVIDHNAADHAAETHRHAYNAAFGDLSLSWHWDAAAYARLQVHGKDSVRAYVETEQSHLLRAYDADFLVNAIESAKARYYDSMARSQPRVSACAEWVGDPLSRLAA